MKISAENQWKENIEEKRKKWSEISRNEISKEEIISKKSEKKISRNRKKKKMKRSIENEYWNGEKWRINVKSIE